MSAINQPNQNFLDRVAALQKDVDTLKRTSLTRNGIIHNGYLAFYGPDSGSGEIVRTRIGLQADGTYTIKAWDTAGVLISFGGGGSSNLDGLTDVIITGPSTGQVLQYNGANWVNSAATGIAIAGDITGTLGASAIAAGVIVNADVSALAAITYNKLSLTGAVVNADLAGSIAYSKLSLTGAILNADLAGSIAYSKLSLTGAILNTDLAGSIAYSKLSLTGAILNADLAGSITYSKLSLTGAILNADLAGSIAFNKISAPAANFSMNSFKITNLLAGSVSSDALRYDQVIGVYAPQATVDTTFDARDAKQNVRVGFFPTPLQQSVGLSYSATTITGVGSVIDGVTMANGDRIFAVCSSDDRRNGIYTYNSSGTITRAPDCDLWTEVAGHTYAEEGTLYAGTGWMLIPATGGTFGTTSIPYVTISASSTQPLSGDITGTLGATTIATGVIVNADVNASAAIAYSKLNLTGAVLNADLAGSIAYSKLSLTGSVVNADIGAAAAIVYSKLSLTGAILNADLAGSIALTKLVAPSSGQVIYGSGTTATWGSPDTAGIVDKSSTQTISGSKTFSADLNMSGSAYIWLNTNNTLRISGRLMLRDDQYTNSQTLTTSGFRKVFSGSTAAQTLTLPTTVNTPATMQIENAGSVNITVAAGVSETIIINNTSVTTLTLRPGEALWLSSNGQASSVTWNAYLMVGTSLTNAPLAGEITGTLGATTIAANVIVNADINSAAAIAYSKLALTGAILNADLAGSITYSKLSLTGAILNADLAGSIAYSKLSLTGAVLNADLAGSIAYSKLSLTGAILNADLAGSIAYSKLSLTGAILNADLAGSIAYSKLSLTNSIMNTDINSIASIAGSKINPAFTQSITSTVSGTNPCTITSSTGGAQVIINSNTAFTASLVFQIAGIDKGYVTATSSGVFLKNISSLNAIQIDNTTSAVILGNATGTLTSATNLAMGAFKITGLAAGSVNGDALRYEQVVGVYAPLSFPTFSGSILTTYASNNQLEVRSTAGTASSIINGFTSAGLYFSINSAGSGYILGSTGSINIYNSAGNPGFVMLHSTSDVTVGHSAGTLKSNSTTPPVGDSSSNIANTAFVQQELGNPSSSRPGVMLYNPTPTTIGAGSATLITTWGTESFDNDTMHDPTTNPGRITIKSAGNYVVSARMDFAAVVTSGGIYASISKNGTVVCNQSGNWLSAGTARTILEVNFQALGCVVGDYFEVSFFQSTGATRTLTLTSDGSSFSAMWIGNTAAAWGNAGARAYLASGHATFPTGNYTAVVMNGEDWDIGGMHAASDSKLICVIPGKYHITAQISIPNIAGTVGAAIKKNGVTVANQQQPGNNNVGNAELVQTSCTIDLNTGDYVELFGYQSSGATQALGTGSGVTWIEAFRTGYSQQAPESTYPVKWVLSGNCVVNSQSSNVSQISKSGGTAAWDSQVYSTDGYIAGAFVSFQAAALGTDFMVGLNSDPALNATYTSIDYAFYAAASNVVTIYENGVSRGSFGSYTTNTIFKITYDGGYVRYWINGTLVYTTVRASGTALYMDSSFNTVGCSAKNVIFGPTISDIIQSSEISVNTYNGGNYGTGSGICSHSSVGDGVGMYLVEYWCLAVSSTVASVATIYINGSTYGNFCMAQPSIPASALTTPIYMQIRCSAWSGAQTLSVTWSISAGVGTMYGGGAYPMMLRVTRV